MLLAIKMPVWLVDFWTVYGEMITPVLVTLLLAIVTAIALKIRSDAKVNAAKADLQIEALKQVANREDNKPQLEAQSQEIEDLKIEKALYKGEVSANIEARNIYLRSRNLSKEDRKRIQEVIRQGFEQISNQDKIDKEDE